MERKTVDTHDVIKPGKSLVGVDGNAFMVIGFVRRALKEAGNPPAILERYQAEATADDYNHLLFVSMEYLGQPSDRAEAEDDVVVCHYCGKTFEPTGLDQVGPDMFWCQ